MEHEIFQMIVLFRSPCTPIKEKNGRRKAKEVYAYVCVSSIGIFIAISARLYSDCQATVYRHLADSRAKRPDMDSREMARCFFSDQNEKQRRESVLCPLKSDTAHSCWILARYSTNLDFRFFPFLLPFSSHFIVTRAQYFGPHDEMKRVWYSFIIKIVCVIHLEKKGGSHSLFHFR